MTIMRLIMWDLLVCSLFALSLMEDVFINPLLVCLLTKYLSIGIDFDE